MQRINRERRLAAPDAIVAREQRRIHRFTRPIAVDRRRLALGDDLLAPPGDRFTLRGLRIARVLKRVFGLRRLPFRFADRIARAHELRFLFGEHGAREIELGHQRRGLLGAALNQGLALGRDGREAVAARAAVQRINRERRLAAPDAIVAREQRRIHRFTPLGRRDLFVQRANLGLQRLQPRVAARDRDVLIL